MYQRLIKPSKSKSFFLFGVRGSGKSTWLSSFFSKELRANEVLWIDLLIPESEREYLLHPSRLLERALQGRQYQWVVVDEVQKVPKLLDVVQLGITKHQLKFALTGSSARKLRRGAANLLAGRALTYQLFPLTVVELGKDFDLLQTLQFGTLPEVILTNDPTDKVKFLQSYVHTYLREEIQTEQLVRNMEPFYMFLEVAAQSAAEPLNFSNLGREAGIDSKSVERYFQLLEDTLVGFYLPSFHRSIRKQQSKARKFYFIDVGIQRALAQVVDLPVRANTYDYGRTFEQWLIAEIYKLNLYYSTGFRLSHLRTKDGLEIDLILTKPRMRTLLIEVKAAANVTTDHTKALRLLGKEFGDCRRMILCQEKSRRTTEGIEIMPWQVGLKEIFGR